MPKGKPSKGRRPYHSPTRKRQAEETSRRVLEAARGLLLTGGYAGTTVDSIAAAAEVSPKTVAAIFGSKRGILTALLEPSAFGSRFQELVGHLRAASVPQDRVRLAAQLTRQAYVVLGAEFELLRTASGVTADLKPLAAMVETRRRENLARLVAYVGEREGLRGSLSRKEITDVLLVLTSYDTYRTLVLERHWEPDRYELWLGKLMTTTLFGEARPQAPSLKLRV